MPLVATSWFEPSSQAVPYILEDRYLKGGFKILPDLQTMERGQHPFSLKKGMLVYVEEDENFYQLKEFTPPVNATWELAKFGSIIDAVESPLLITDGILKIDPSAKIPTGGLVGQVLTPKGDGTLHWVDASAAVRDVKIFSPTITLNQHDSYDFEMELGKTVMLLKLKLNAPDLEVTAFPTKERSEINPYKFISTSELEYDQGVTIQDGGGMEFHRRFSFLSNLESPVESKIYFTIRNLGASPVVPRVEAYYLRFE